MFLQVLMLTFLYQHAYGSTDVKSFPLELCTKLGPDYWCFSTGIAEACHVTDYCKNYVWLKEHQVKDTITLPESSTISSNQVRKSIGLPAESTISFSQVETSAGTSELGTSMQCKACRFITKKLLNMGGKKISKMVLRELCLDTPNPIIDVACLALVQVFGDRIVHALDNITHIDQLCTAIHVCSSSKDNMGRTINYKRLN